MDAPPKIPLDVLLKKTMKAKKQESNKDSSKKLSRYSTDFPKDQPASNYGLSSDAKILAVRPPGAPSIIEEFKVSPDNPLKIRMYQHQSPGDIIVLTAALRDLHKAYPKHFITDVRATVPDIFKENPYVTSFDDPKDPSILHLFCTYTDAISRSNVSNRHFIEAFHNEFERRLGIKIPVTKGVGEIFLSEQERSWGSRVFELLETEVPFWIIDAGRKSDFTNKLWAIDRFQAVVDAFPQITFVQIGSNAKGHYHPALKGDNVINEVGKTTVRQLIRLMYHSAGVITPVSFPMHLSAATPIHEKYRFRHRPTIVIAGSREPKAWEAYTNHSYLDNCGILPCGGQGGCWKSRVIPLGDGDKKDKSLCEKPVKLATGQTIPKCMDMITAEQVITALQNYLDNTY